MKRSTHHHARGQRHADSLLDNFRNFWLCALLLSVISPKVMDAAERTHAIVSPNGSENKFGNVASGFDGRFQQIYANTEFASAPSDLITITGVAFRWDENITSSEVVLPYLRIRIGTFTKPFMAFVQIIDFNVADDYRIVYSAENVPMKVRPAVSVDDFSVKFVFNEPFYYDRRNGHILLGLDAIRPPNFTGGLGFDVENSNALQARVRSLASPGLIPYSFGGLVTQFQYTAIPEPRSATLFVVTGMFILLFRTRRKHGG